MASSFPQSRLDLTCEPSAVRHARKHARDIAERWGLPCDVAGDCSLIVDELVANAIRHASGATKPFSPAHGQPEVRQCSLMMWVSARQLVIAVSDESQNPPVRPPSAESKDGRGLHLISGLTDGQWGFQFNVGHPGKLVWAKLPVPASDSPGKAADGRSDGNHADSLWQEVVGPSKRSVNKRYAITAAARRHANTR
ncbi:ATP-binding protein [Streptomyces sp. NPDC087422]|uniref:ATP-binding protein n=1 Tax=Streptomyces sp. NPDC087422 TaxID=3365786 RepID=UPI0038047086